MSMADDDWLESICKETPMSMTKDELRPEEGEPEEERVDQHDPRDYEGHALREVQSKAWEEGFRRAMDVFNHMTYQSCEHWNPYRP